METNQTKQTIRLERVFGIILLIPPTIGVILFLINLVSNDPGRIPEMRNLSSNWTGDYNYARDSGGGGYTSAAPIYLGLMAIAGALLLKGTDKKLD
ncbi:hypothetical protein FRZ67_16005 [Panacibacter ginsenosidivorans]|uniref:Uncharacterized protein n=1 Tax=Panacibacter ginsenosidivorans TaxID=1813871 RepID=A0A5B8VBB7_9BACT|nr:hypothetical protein [Panacibacter ginsenosidivorans]QEC68734.1 hypothetical protein FRZ67_16005 [Panacibacter ginsenosidivorans]